MKKFSAKPIIMSALAALAFGTVSVGTTFALFTDKAETKINVKAGVVDVDNEISIKEVKELGGVDAVKDANEKLYTNSIGSTTELLSNKAVKLTNWVPGDKAVFTINSVNKSNVNIKTRFTVKHTTSDPDKDLYEALTISYKALDENNQDIGYKFMDWNLLPAVSEADIANGGKVISKVEVTVEFKDDGDKTIRERTEGENNGYQGKDCEIIFTQEAVQGNASVKSKIEEMNALLAAELTPNKTMHEALSDVSSVMDASQLLTVGYVWNAETDRFAYPEEAPTASKYKYFKVYNEMPAVADQEFSVYAYGTGWTTTAVNLNGIGFDAGAVSGIASVSYTNDGDSRDVVIRTNGGNLTINAKNDNVTHYGYADSVNVVDVATSSYHENGTVKFLEVAAGHIVLEKDSDVSAVHFDATNGIFENADGKTISIDLSKVNTNDISFSRDAVTIAENGTYVAEVTTDGTEYIWLFGNGIKEQMVVTNTTDTIAENGTLKAGITAGAEDGSVAEQIANPAKRNEQGQLVNDNNEVVTAENAVVEEVASKEDVQAGATLFAGGSGTESDPFLIEDFDTMQMISFYSDRAYNSRYYSYYSSQSNGAEFVASYEDSYGKYNPSYANWDVYYKVKDGVTIIDCSEASRKWTGVYLIGHFDGNGVTFKNLVGAPLFDGIDGTGSTPTVIKNFNVDNCLIMTGSYYVGAVVRYCYYDVTFEDISISGYLEANSPASFLGQGNFFDKDCTINFIRCHSNMNLVSLNAQAGGFTGNLFGSYYNKNHLCTVNLIDSYFDGSLAVASGTRFSYVECHTATPIKYSISYTNEALENQCSPLYSTGHTEAKDVNYLGSTKTITKGTLSLPETGSVFNVSKTTGAVSAKAYLIVGLNPGNFTAIFVSEEIDLSGVTDSFSTSKVKNYNVVVNDGTHNKTEIIGDTLYIYDSRYESGYGSLTFMVVQYDSLGGIVSVNTKSK